MVPAFYRATKLLLVSTSMISAAGCLNLGGRTTNVHNNPQTNGRLSALETRVSALEQAFQTTSVEVPAPVQFLLSLTESLKPQGRIGIVNYKPGSGGPGPTCRRVPDAVVMRDANQANLRVISTMDLRFQYLVVLGR